jgi:hypothetical protein
MAWQPGGRKARTNGPRREERTRPTCGPRCIAKFGFLKKNPEIDFLHEENS